MIEINGPANIVMMLNALDTTDNSEFQKEMFEKIRREAMITINYIMKLKNESRVTYGDVKRDYKEVTEES